MLKPLVPRLLLGPGVGPEEQDRRADEQADVADADGEERLEGGPGVGLLLPPVPDEHERAEAHDLPAEDQLDHVLGEDHHEHAGREQRDGGEEVGVAAVAADVLEREDLHEQRDEGDEEEQHHRQAVDLLADAKLDAAALPPGPLRITGSTYGSAWAPSLAAMLRAKPAAMPNGPADSVPRRRRCAGSTGRRCRRRARRRRHRQQAELGALHRQALAEQDDEEEGDARDRAGSARRSRGTSRSGSSAAVAALSPSSR